MIHAATRTFGIIYIDGLHHLLCTNHLTKPKGEPMIPFVAMGWIHLVTVLFLLNIHEICLKLKSGFRIIHKFPTFQKPYSCVYSILAIAGPSDAMRPEKLGDGENFHHWQNEVKFWLMSMGCGGLSTP
jgi:hypothetical protein